MTDCLLRVLFMLKHNSSVSPSFRLGEEDRASQSERKRFKKCVLKGEKEKRVHYNTKYAMASRGKQEYQQQTKSVGN